MTESLEITISAFSIFLRSWSSTSCNTEIKYRYNPTLKRGEVLISREFSQDCQRCNTSIKPKFDDEACEKAVEKILTRIKRVFYNQAPTSNEFSERHSGAQMRENPHDSSRCEACKEGKCPDADFSSSRPRRSFENRIYSGAQTGITWMLISSENQSNPRIQAQNEGIPRIRNQNSPVSTSSRLVSNGLSYRNVAAQKAEFSDGHSRAQRRENPYDSSRCEACNHKEERKEDFTTGRFIQPEGWPGYTVLTL